MLLHHQSSYTKKHPKSIVRKPKRININGNISRVINRSKTNQNDLNVNKKDRKIKELKIDLQMTVCICDLICNKGPLLPKHL